MPGAAENIVIPEDSIVGQSKQLSPGLTEEGMIVPVPAGPPLRCHTGMSHDDLAILRDAETQPVGFQRALIDTQMIVGTVGNPSGIGAAFFTLCR